MLAWMFAKKSWRKKFVLMSANQFVSKMNDKKSRVVKKLTSTSHKLSGSRFFQLYLGTTLIILVLTVTILLNPTPTKKSRFVTHQPTNYWECTIAKGSKVRTTYPATCITKDNKQFTQEVTELEKQFVDKQSEKCTIENWETYTNYTSELSISFDHQEKSTTQNLVDFAKEYLSDYSYPPVPYFMKLCSNKVLISFFFGMDHSYRAFLPKNNGKEIIIITGHINPSKKTRDKYTAIFFQILSTFKFIDETANWKTYRNEEYEFQIDYPADWIYGEKTDKLAIAPNTKIKKILFSPASVFDINPGAFSISLFEPDINLNLDEFIETYICFPHPEVERCSDVFEDNTRFSTDDSLPAKKIIIHPVISFSESVVFKKDEVFFEFEINFGMPYYPRVTPDEKREMFDQILSTFKFLN
jgi:hypothetical protein